MPLFRDDLENAQRALKHTKIIIQIITFTLFGERPKGFETFNIRIKYVKQYHLENAQRALKQNKMHELSYLQFYLENAQRALKHILFIRKIKFYINLENAQRALKPTENQTIGLTTGIWRTPKGL